MIDVRQSHELSARRFWSGTVRQTFRTLGIDRKVNSENIAESLAVFCQQHSMVSDHDLSLLMARSFYSTGDTDSARQVLHNTRTHRLYAESWLDVLSVDYPFPELYPLFSTRVVRPLCLTSAGFLWVLDFERIRSSDNHRHELILFQTVRMLTEKVSNVWEKTNGRGTLGLKGLSGFCGRNQVPSFVEHICAVLKHCAQQNGWKDVPTALLIDL